MVNVIIAGLPNNMKISKFIEFMERNIFLEKIKVNVNYLRWYKPHLRKLSLSMKSNDARKAIRYLNGYEYMSRRMNYSLGCWKEDIEDRSDDEDGVEPPSKMMRTLSPFDKSDELQVIDQKIELIRKERILLEEESQLLLQKKRLEMIQNLGPNDFQKLLELEEMHKINESVSETRVKGLSSKTPFQGPWQIIFQKMKGVVNAYVDEQYRPIFIDLLRTRVKNRLALVLNGKGYMTTKQILALYRSIHPEETDISLMQEVLLKINQIIYPINETTKCHDGEENVQDNPKDDIDVNDVKTTELDSSQNEEVVFLEDVNPDLQETTQKQLGFANNKLFEKEVKDKDMNVSETNNTDVKTHQIEEKNTLEKINKNQCKELNKRSEEINLDINKEICINETKFASVNTNKVIEPALDEVLDMDNDLDDWIEDEKDDQQTVHAAISSCSELMNKNPDWVTK